MAIDAKSSGNTHRSICSTQQVAAKDSVTAYILCETVPKVRFVLHGRLQKGNKSPFCQKSINI